MLQRLAEVTDTEAPKKDQIIRAVTALLERFKTIRTGRIHQQFVNMRVYALGLLLLVPICAVFIANADIFLQRGADDVASLAAVSAPPAGGVLAWVGALLRENVMAFVFFGGLAGGFFSVVIRVRDQNLEPGEGA